MKIEVNLSHAYRLLNPGPLVLISTFCKGKANIQTLGWITPLDFFPPKLAMVVSDENHTYACIMETGEFVVNIPGTNLAKQAIWCGSVSGRTHDKFAEFGLTPVPGKAVKAPLIAEYIGHLECVHVERKLAQKFGLFLGEVKAASAEEGFFKERWLVEKEGARTLHHLGGSLFTSAAGLLEP